MNERESVSDPPKIPLFIAAAVCVSLQFAALTVQSMVSFDNHIPFFGNLVDFYNYFGYLDGGYGRVFTNLLIGDVLNFAYLVLNVIGVFLARKNLWVLSSGWICYLLCRLYSWIRSGSAGLMLLVITACALCAALVLILVQTGKIRSRKIAMIPFAVIAAAYLAITLPLVLWDLDAASFVLALAYVAQPVSCALLIGAMLFKTDAVILPKPIIEVKVDEENNQ